MAEITLPPYVTGYVAIALVVLDVVSEHKQQ